MKCSLSNQSQRAINQQKLRSGDRRPLTRVELMETNDGSHAGGENVPEDRGGFLEARTLIPPCVEKFVHTTI